MNEYEFKINFSLLDKEVTQGEYLSVEIIYPGLFVTDCFIEITSAHFDDSEINNLRIEKLCSVPVNKPGIYDISIPLSFPLSYENETKYELAIIHKGEKIGVSDFTIIQPNFISEMIYIIEKFFNFQKAVVYSDASSSKITWCEFDYTGRLEPVNLIIAINYDFPLKIMVGLSKGNRYGKSIWKKEHFELYDIHFSSYFMKTKLDDIFGKLSPEQILYRDDNDNDLEQALLMTEEASEKLMANDPDGAFKLLKEAESIKDIPQIHNELGKYMIEQNFPIEMAVKELKKAENLDPEGYPLIGGYLYIVETLLSRGDYDLAVSLAYEADNVYSGNPFDFYQMGSIFKNFSKYSDSIHFFTYALNLQPDDPLYLAEIGECYIELKEFENAIRCLKKASDIYPYDPESHALTLLAKAYHKAGDITLARETAYKVLEICSDFFTCGINISEKGFISLFDKDLWNAFIDKFPEMEDIKFGVFQGKKSDFPNMGGIFI